MNAARHVPVLAREVVDALQPRDGGRYLDGTFGAGGYATAMLDRADCQVIAIDRDPDAIAADAIVCRCEEVTAGALRRGCYQCHAALRPGPVPRQCGSFLP